MMIVYFSTPFKFNLVSWLIKKFLGTKYSHASIMFELGDRFIVFEASHGDVHMIEHTNWLVKNKVIKSFTIQKTPEEQRDILNYLIDNCQDKYGILTLFGILLNVKLGKDGDKRFICSELVAKALGLSDNDFITPKDLEKMIEEKYVI